MKKFIYILLYVANLANAALTYPIVETFDYTDNGNGTILDNKTKLIWTKTADTNKDGKIDVADKFSLTNAREYAKTAEIGGYKDWRLPTIKELYSLIDFVNGEDVNPVAQASGNLKPFINTKFFGFAYGDINARERIIDSQFATSTIYTSTTMNGNKNKTMFGVNFADGRIKGYPSGKMRGRDKQFYVYLVRGTQEYGKNNFVDNKDGTITDKATSLMWAKDDSKKGLDHHQAKEYAKTAQIAGHKDWRLPTAKELQSIVDYSKSPDATKSPSIDDKFICSMIKNEANEDDYPAYWTSTEHKSGMPKKIKLFCYVNFGRSMGYMSGKWIDVHGAGAQRSDPEAGDPARYQKGHGPQGDAIRVYNYVRLVRDI